MFNVAIFPKRSSLAIQDSVVRQDGSCWPWLFAALLGVFVASGGFVTSSSAQDAPAKKDDAAAEDKADKEPDKEENVTLHTIDDWDLTATYYPGAKGKESIPIVLLHGDKGSRKDFTGDDGLALYLQNKGYAVLAPDFRYHGDSAKQNNVAKGKPAPKPKVAKALPPQAYKEMVFADMLAVKRFLWKKNNEEKLNIDKLVLIGSEMGAAVALDTVVYDAKGWDQGLPMVGPLKLGRFVKAIILISPPANQLGLRPLTALESSMFPSDTGVMIVAGKDKGDFNSYKNILAKLRPQVKNAPIEEKTVITLQPDTKLQGMNLIKEFSNPEKDYPGKISYFIELRVENKQVLKENKWSQRKYPHE